MNGLNRLLVRAVGDGGVVAVRNPVQLDNHSEPRPDFAVLKARADDCRRSTPQPEDGLLVIEIADSSLHYHRAVKRP